MKISPTSAGGLMHTLNGFEALPITVRSAERKDRFTIRAMVYQACLNPFGINWKRFIVAEADGKVIGVRQVKVLKDGTREIASGVVLPSFRRRGVGTRLMETLLERESGPLYLMCDGKWAQYYRRFGFQEVDKKDLPGSFRREHAIMRIVFEAASRLVLGEEMSLITMKVGGSGEYSR
ncbi:GNAT family N-acetyltransferase [bacterium]|nr:GNAT family N-acetyltransferase [bacterium]